MCVCVCVYKGSETVYLKFEPHTRESHQDIVSRPVQRC